MSTLNVFATLLYLTIPAVWSIPFSATLTKGYNLTSPDRLTVLPDILHEISGITYVDETTIACVQDENGIVFFFDLVKNQIIRKLYFAGNGDFEGITRVDKTIWVLMSNGVLFEIADYTSEKIKVSTIKTGIPSTDNEGLCHDRKNNRLLIGCKAEIRTEILKNKAVIYAFDLKTRKLVPDPVYVLDLKTIERYIVDSRLNILQKNEKGPGIRLRISALGIHPLTGEIYILSASDNLLCVTNEAGKIEHIESLNKKLFAKAEGLTFLMDGEMLISNEGSKGKPTLLGFRWNKI
jgi:uncharacterized protein YjiK